MNYDLKYSVIYGLISRFITFLNQIISVPLTISLIGINDFSRFSIMTAGVAWIFSLGGSLLPSLVGDITRAKANNDIDKICNYSINSTLALILVAIIFTVIYLFYNNDIYSIEFLVYIIAILNLIFSVSDNIRIGLHQNYINNLTNGASNLITLTIISLLYLFNTKVDLNTIVIVFLGSPLLFKFINFVLVVLKLKIKLFKFDFLYQINLIKKAIGFMVITLSYFLSTSGVLLLLNNYKVSFLNEFVLLQKLSLTIMGIIVMIRNPLWSIISHKVYDGGRNDIIIFYKKVLSYYFVLFPVIVILLSITMKEFVYLWSSKSINIDLLLSFTFALYISSQILSFINSIVYYGLEIFNKVSKWIILEAIIIFLFIVLQSGNLSIESLFIFMFLVSLFSSYKVYKIITHE